LPTDLSTRDQRFVEHSVVDLPTQPIHGLVLGGEDRSDHDQLPRDPLDALICGKRHGNAKNHTCYVILRIAVPLSFAVLRGTFGIARF
jgi:hypothetical protein